MTTEGLGGLPWLAIAWAMAIRDVPSTVEELISCDDLSDLLVRARVFAGENTVAKLKVPDAHIVSASTIKAARRCRNSAGDGIRRHARAEGRAGQQGQFEVDLPTAGWNGKLYFAGGQRIHRGARTSANVEGYATAYTDTGHDAASAVDATWASRAA